MSRRKPAGFKPTSAGSSPMAKSPGGSRFSKATPGADFAAQFEHLDRVRGQRRKTAEDRREARRRQNRRRSADTRAAMADQPLGTKGGVTTWRRPDGSTYTTMSPQEARKFFAQGEAEQRADARRRFPRERGR